MNAHNNCIFCSIIAQKIPAKVIAENDRVIVIEDIAPKAPIHYLIIPKKHIANIASLSKDESSYAQDMLLMAQELSQKNSAFQNFRLLINNGIGVGQTVPHLHCHFLAGKQMSDF